MKLADWIAEKDLTHAEVAELLEVEQPTVSRYVNGTRRPRDRHMVKIVAVTGGKVTANDFLPEAEAQPTVKPEDERPAAARPAA